MIPRFSLQFGDITSMNVEAVVNSTDETLLEGGPVHRAIHEAAGPELAEECARLGRCHVSEVRVTKGFNLSARYILHTVAPTWLGGQRGEESALVSCYLHCLQEAEAQGIKTLAFPSLGSGTQPQIPLDKAAPLVVQTIQDYLLSHNLPEKVILVCFDSTTYRAYQGALRESLP